jgi:predicted nucleotidyltransferase
LRLDYGIVGRVETIPSGVLGKAVGRLKAKFQPAVTYLISSHARGTPTDDSDVDFMVVAR